MTETRLGDILVRENRIRPIYMVDIKLNSETIIQFYPHTAKRDRLLLYRPVLSVLQLL